MTDPVPTPAEPRAASSDDASAAALRGFGPTGILAIFVILLGSFLPYVPLGALLVLAWAHRSRTPWREIGYVRPRSWAVTLAAGIAIGIAFKLLMKSVVMPLLGADPVNHAYHFLVGNSAALPAAIYLMIVPAGFGEETVFRGWMFERLGKLLGPAVPARAAIVLFTTALFALAHYSNQGLAGVQQAAITGFVFGTVRATTGRLPLLMVAHAAFDLTAVWIIYRDLETSVAHLFFR